jgi:hypothetical protein
MTFSMYWEMLPSPNSLAASSLKIRIKSQCCGNGSGIRCFCWHLDSGSGITIRDPQQWISKMKLEAKINFRMLKRR